MATNRPFLIVRRAFVRTKASSQPRSAGQAVYALLLHVTLPHFFLQRLYMAMIPFLGVRFDCRKSIGTSNEDTQCNAWDRGTPPWPAIGQARLDIYFVEDAVPIRGASRRFPRPSSCRSPLRVFGLENHHRGSRTSAFAAATNSD